MRATQNGRSMEAEAHAIITEAVKTSARTPEVNLYDHIRARVEPLGRIELELPPPQGMREPPHFE